MQVRRREVNEALLHSPQHQQAGSASKVRCTRLPPLRLDPAAILQLQTICCCFYGYGDVEAAVSRRAWNLGLLIGYVLAGWGRLIWGHSLAALLQVVFAASTEAEAWS